MALASDFRAPIFSVDFDPSANPGDSTLEYRGLIIGQKTSDGSMSTLTLTKINSPSDANAKAGAGSQIALMAKAWFSQNQNTPLWAIATAMPGEGAVQSVRTFEIDNTATAAGNLYWYVNGVRVIVAVQTGDTPEVMATNTLNALSQYSDLPFDITIATTDGGYNVIMTAKCAGQAGDRLDARLNYQDGEMLPAAVEITASHTYDAGGHDPSISGVVAALGDEWFQTIISAFSPDFTTDNITTLNAELVDRFGPIRMIDGTAFMSIRGANLSGLESAATDLNSPHICIPHSFGLLQSPYEYAAEIGAIVAREAEADPALPITDLEVVGVAPPVSSQRFTLTENNMLLHDAISTFTTVSGRVKVQRLITTYLTDSQGNADTSYLNVETMNTLRYLRFDFRRQMSRDYSRAKIADDSAYIPPGQTIMTPTVGRAAAIAIFKTWMALGLVTNLEAFKANLTVARDPNNATRMNFLLPPNLIGQLIVTAATFQFRNQ